MAGYSKYDGRGDAARSLRPGEVFLRSSLVKFGHPEPPPWLLWYFDDKDVVVVAATVLPKEASAKAEERRGRR